jgi:D-alanyl-lipoteichoic acid acyltransferase DltB (MBOAT superfamily)
MLFNSLTYIVFLLALAPFVVLGRQWLRNGVLLFGSLTFYAFWRIDFTGLVAVTALIDWFGARQIQASANPATRRFWLTLSVVMNLSLLCFFKYFKMIVGSGLTIAGLVGIEIRPPDEFRNFLENIILPLGISFYTFHSLSYVFDVYRGVVRPVTRFTDFLTYVLFWTQLVAGPILRTAQVVPQLVGYRRPSAGELVYGLEEIVQGLFKKLVIADQLAPLVDYGYSLPAAKLGMLDVWVLAFSFGFQIYFDFSGYSQIALGSARIMGFHFPPNFHWPYLAASPKEFWQRWHISLSSWIRDYLYVPLLGGGFHPRDIRRGASTFDTELETKRISEARRTFALFATWFIMGLWHGANWTFALWGLWHALLVFAHRLVEPWALGLRPIVRLIGGWAVTLPLAMLGWVFFRAQTVPEALTMVAIAFDLSKLPVRVIRENHYLIVACLLLGMLALAGILQLFRERERLPIGWLLYPVMAGASGVMLAGIGLTLRQAKTFIYFQF